MVIEKIRSRQARVNIKKLIEGCKKGDEAARKELYERYSAPMYGLCCRYMRDRDLARDMLHDGFITLFTHIEDYRGAGSFDGWCRRIFVNTALSYLRKRNPLNEADSVDDHFRLEDSSASAIDEISTQELLDCMNELPSGYRTIINLYAIDGYSHREVADIMNITESTSRTQYLRAKSRLIRIMTERGIDNKNYKSRHEACD